MTVLLLFISDIKYVIAILISAESCMTGSQEGYD